MRDTRVSHPSIFKENSAKFSDKKWEPETRTEVTRQRFPLCQPDTKKKFEKIYIFPQSDVGRMPVRADKSPRQKVESQ